MNVYTPNHHFWIGELGIYSSKQQKIIPSDDPTFLGWKAAGGVATPWPKDGTGIESEAALAEVLVARGLRMYPPSIVEIRAARCLEVSNYRDTLMVAGVQYRDRVFDSDNTAQLRITGAIVEMTLIPGADPFKSWVDINNMTILLSIQELMELGGLVTRHVSGCVLQASYHKDEINKLETAEALAAYDITVGWP